MGWIKWIISRCVPLNNKRKRITFTPPVVDAAQPPVMAKNMINIGANDGHKLKELDVRPVVVDRDMTLKRLLVKARCLSAEKTL